MAVMYRFCKYFSVRLGTVLVAIASMIQSFMLGGVVLLGLNNVTKTKSTLEDFITSYKLIYVTDIFLIIMENTKIYLQCAIVFLMLHIYTCCLVIYGAIKCNVPLVWPFLVVEFIRLGFLFFVHFTAMMLIKENILDLGLLIALSLSGGFILLGLYYMWFCVVSLCQCIRELKDPIGRQTPTSVNLLASDFKHLTQNLERRFPLTRPSATSVSPTWGLQPVASLRHRDFQYGNLGCPTN